MIRTALVGMLLSAALVLSSCKDKPNPPAPRGQQPAAATSAHETLPAETPDLGSPIYDLEMSLTDQDGRRVSLDTFRGHPVVISMFYGTCPYACPTLISDIKRLDQSLDEETRKDLRILLVSFDPERDTQARLSELARQHALDMTRFKLCRAPESQVRELAAVLGIKYRKLESGGFNHSSVITVLGSDGKSVGRVDGLNQPVSQLVKAVRDARAMRVR